MASPPPKPPITLLVELERLIAEPADDEDECRKCHSPVSVEPTMEPTGLCHPCAQDILAQHGPALLASARAAVELEEERNRLRALLDELAVLAKSQGHLDEEDCAYMLKVLAAPNSTGKETADGALALAREVAVLWESKAVLDARINADPNGLARKLDALVLALLGERGKT